MKTDGSPAIADLALLGDTRTAALSGPDGSISWMCVPRFDADPVFAALIGGTEGGHFTVAPHEPTGPPARRYLDDTTVVETVWPVDGGEVVLTEGMVAATARTGLPRLVLVRRVATRGRPVDVRVVLDARSGDDRRRLTGDGEVGVVRLSSPSMAVALRSDPGLTLAPGATTVVTVDPSTPLTLSFSAAEGPATVDAADPDVAWAALEAGCHTWRAWVHGADPGHHRVAAVRRSLITLRLLTHTRTGAPIAAPTTSLPEEIGGVRNWDYRFAWPRDASIGVGAFLGCGLVEQAREFLHWLATVIEPHRPALPPMLTLDGHAVPPERELAGWPGWHGSVPVRFGNGARAQHQLDGYGWVVDAMCLLDDAGSRLYDSTWDLACDLADFVSTSWSLPDAGIWEERDAPAHHVHSKLMAWLALDRALHLARVHDVEPARARRWATARADVEAEVGARGFDRDRGCFVRAYDSRELDASLLVLPLLGIEPATSPRVVSTVRAIRHELDAGGGLLYRYPPGTDGLPGAEGAFVPCAFWAVQALAATGAVDEAGTLFESLVDRGGTLGLFAEEIDPSTGNFLGNHPQALSHASMVQAALAIGAAERSA